MHHLPRPPRLAGAAVLVLGLVVAACGNAGDDDDTAATTTTAADDGTTTTAGEVQPIEGVPGVTDDAIRFVALGTSSASAPNATCSLDCYVDGIEAYFAYRNAEGGVHGRQLELARVVDDELVNNQVKALEVLESDDAFGIFSYTLLASGFPDIAAAGVPLYTSPVSAGDANGIESAFAVPGGALCTSCPNPVYTYLAGQVGATRVASLGYGIAQSSKDCVAGQVASLERYGSSAGVEVAYSNDELAYGLPNGAGPEVTAMTDAGVDLVLTCLDGNAALIIAQELQRQGHDDVVMVLPGEGYGDPAFFERSGGIFEGDVMTISGRPAEADRNEAMEHFVERMAEMAPEADRSYAMWGWLAADLAYRGLVEAGPQFDRQAVIDATNQLTEFTADGLMPPVDWTRQHTAPTPDDLVTNGPALSCLAAVRITADGYEMLTDVESPWACWEAGLEAYEEPEMRDFE